MEDNKEQIKEVLSLMDDNFLDPSLIVDNKLYFEFNKKSYRVVMPSAKDLSKAEMVKNKTYGILLSTEGYHLLDNLKRILKEKQNIDIDKLEEDKKLIIERLQDKYLELASLGESKELEKIDVLKDEIESLKRELQTSNYNIEKYLFPSIEKQMEAKYIEYLTFLCTQENIPGEEEKYKQAWENIEDFENDRSALSIKSLNRMTQLLLNSREIL